MPEVPEGWRSTTLGASGNLGARRPRPFKGRQPYVATADLVAGQVRPSEIVSFIERPARADLELRPGDVLQAKMKATDKSLLVASELDGWLASTGFAQFSPQVAGNDPGFFFHWVSSARFHYLKDALCVGSTQQAISDRELGAIRLALPPPEEQARIAEILSTIDEAIRRTEQVVAKLQQMKQGLLLDLLTRGIDKNGELRNPETHPDQFAETSLGVFPRGWGLMTLDELRDRDTPITYGVLKPGPYVQGGVPLLQIGDVIHGGLDADRVHRIGPELDREYSRTRVQGGELVISLVGTIGRVAQLPADLGTANLHRNLGLFRPGKDVDPAFMLHYLRSGFVERQIAQSTYGTTQALLNLESVRSLVVPVPSSDEQEHIGKVCDGMDERLAEERAVAGKLRLLRLGLMDDLLSGRVRVGRQ